VDEVVGMAHLVEIFGKLFCGPLQVLVRRELGGHLLIRLLCWGHVGSVCLKVVMGK
jgi:hypothetical protein